MLTRRRQFFLAFLLAATLSACGQKGALYLPDKAADVVTRPTQTPPTEPSVAPPGNDAQRPAPPTDESPPDPTLRPAEPPPR